MLIHCPFKAFCIGIHNLVIVQNILYLHSKNICYKLQIYLYFLNDMTAIDEAIAIAGSQKKLGKMIGVSQQRISCWKRKGFPAPEFVIPIEKFTGIHRGNLRPDLYPKEKNDEA